MAVVFLGFSGPVLVIFLILIIYGIPTFFGIKENKWWALLAVFGIAVLTSLFYIITSPDKYLSANKLY